VRNYSELSNVRLGGQLVKKYSAGKGELSLSLEILSV